MPPYASRPPRGPAPIPADRATTEWIRRDTHTRRDSTTRDQQPRERHPRYSEYTRRNGAHVGWENSHTTKRPPGRVTRSNSRSPASRSCTLRNPKEIVTASKASSAKGSDKASPATKDSRGLRSRPTESIPKEKSHATTKGPAAAIGSLEVPVPAARSRTRSPGSAPTAAATAFRHRRV